MDQVLAKVKNEITSIEADIKKTDITTRDLNRLGTKSIGSATSIERFHGALFRKSIFKLTKPESDYGFILRLDGKTIAYSELCNVVRTYLLKNNLVSDDGSITCDLLFSRLTSKAVSTKISFFEILRNFRYIVV